MTLLVGFTWSLFSKVNHIIRNTIAIVFILLLSALNFYLIIIVDKSILNYHYLCVVFPFCASFIITALVYRWIEIVRKRKTNKQLVLVTIVYVIFILLTYVSYNKEWFSIAESVNLFIITPFMAGAIVHLIQSSYLKQKKNHSA